jgi:ABC-type transporter MlaC component
MMRRFLLTTWFALLAAAAAAPFQAAAAAGPDDFIRSLGNQAIDVIRSGASPDQKSAYFHRALYQDFESEEYFPFCSRPVWHGASEPKRQQIQRYGGHLAGLLANMGAERGSGSSAPRC